MADKKKPNYATALQGKASPKPATDASQESIEVDVGGQPVKVLRGDMTEAEWSNVKKRALPTKSASMKDKPLGWSDLMGLAQNLDGVSDAVVSKEQKDLLKKTDEWTRAEFLRKRFKNEGYEVPPNSADDERASYKDGKKAEPEKATVVPSTVEYDTDKDAGVTKPAQGSPDEWKPMPTKQPNQGGPGTQTEDDPMVGMGGSMRNPASFVPQMAMGATPREKGTRMMPEMDLSAEGTQMMPEMDLTDAAQTAALQNAVKQVTDNNDTSVSPTATAGPVSVKPTVMVKPMQFGANIVQPDGVTADQPSAMDNIASFVGGIPEEVGAMFGVGAPAQRGQTLADPIDDKYAQQGKTPVAPVPTGGVSGAVSGRVPGKAGMPAAPAESDYERQLKQAAREEQALIAAQSGIDQEKAAKTMELMSQHQAQREKLVADEQKRQAVYEDTLAKHETSFRDLQQQVLAASKESVDPNRYWNNKNEGQKAAAVIAGALFGFTGQGMQWVQRIDSLVEQDMQAQAADLNRKRGYLQDASALQNNLVAMAEAKGLRGKQAYDAAMAVAKENLANQIQMNAMNYAQPELRVKAEQMALAVRQGAAKDVMSYQRQAQNDAMDRRVKMAQINHLEAQSYAARIAANAKESGKGGETPPGIRTELAKIDAGLAAVKEARDAVKGGRSIPAQIVDQIALNFGDSMRALKMGALATQIFPDTSGRDYVASGAQENVLKAVKGENLLENDIDRAQPRWARPGFAADNEAWLNSMEEQLVAKRNSLASSDKEASVQPMQTPLRTLTPAGR